MHPGLRDSVRNQDLEIPDCSFYDDISIATRILSFLTFHDNEFEERSIDQLGEFATQICLLPL